MQTFNISFSYAPILWSRKRKSSRITVRPSLELPQHTAQRTETVFPGGGGESVSGPKISKSLWVQVPSESSSSTFVRRLLGMDSCIRILFTLRRRGQPTAAWPGSNILQTLWLANITRMKFIIRRKLLFSPSSTGLQGGSATACDPLLPSRQSYKIIIMDMLKRSEEAANTSWIIMCVAYINHVYFEGADIPRTHTLSHKLQAEYSPRLADIVIICGGHELSQ